MNDIHKNTLEELTPQDVRDLLAARRIVLIDVREPEEFATERIAASLPGRPQACQ